MFPSVKHVLTAKPVLTVDIVNFSTRTVEEQAEAVQALIGILGQAIPSEYNHPSARIWSPAGDGGAITFWETDIRTPLETAINIGGLVKKYNEGTFTDQKRKTLLAKPSTELVVRMGIHFGTVSKEIDFDDRENVWGDGINISARLISLAKAGQIVISQEFFDHANLRGGWADAEIIWIGKWWAKHNKSITLYNVSANNAGIRFSDVDNWFGPLHYPLEQAIRIYEGMLKEEATLKDYPFRVAVIAKRILDLDPQHTTATSILQSLSKKRQNLRVGQKTLNDPFFSELSPSTILHFFKYAQFKVFENGEIIVREGDKADSMMIVVSGEINLYREERVVMIYDKDKNKETEYIFQEGQIIGEMGLFNTAERRTATLRAGKRAMTLSIDYSYIQTKNPDLLSQREKDMRLEIQRQVWQYYCRRTIENKLLYHSLFRDISEIDRIDLLDNAEFFPSDYQRGIELKIEDFWHYWFVVVVGDITLYSKNNDKELRYRQDECIGPIRLVVEQLPFSRVGYSSDVQYIRIPWKIISYMMERSIGFTQTCLSLGHSARMSLDLI